MFTAQPSTRLTPLHRRSTAAAVVLATSLCAAPVWATPPVYHIVDLPPVANIPAAQQSNVTQAINKNGDVAGYLVTYFPGLPHDQHKNFGAIWPADGSGPILLASPQPTRPNDNVIPWGINNARWVAGDSVDFFGEGYAPELWTSRETPTVLSNKGYGQAVGINESGIVVGYVQGLAKEAPAIATYWTPDNTAHSIGSAPGSAVGINDAGYIAGNMGAPFIRDPAGNISYLGNSSGQPQTGSLYATAINNSNQVVGSCDSSSLPKGIACIWEPDGTVVDLGRINDGNRQQSYTAWSINNAGQVLGVYVYFLHPTAVTQVPFLWTPEDGMMEVSDLIDPADPLYSWAGDLTIHSINDQGVIIANNYVNGHGVKLVPNVPPTIKAP